jgi:hypothetical protein
MKLQACTRLSSVEQKQLELTEFLNQGSESLPAACLPVGRADRFWLLLQSKVTWKKTKEETEGGV